MAFMAIRKSYETIEICANKKRKSLGGCPSSIATGISLKATWNVSLYMLIIAVRGSNDLLSFELNIENSHCALQMTARITADPGKTLTDRGYTSCCEMLHHFGMPDGRSFVAYVLKGDLPVVEILRAGLQNGCDALIRAMRSKGRKNSGITRYDILSVLLSGGEIFMAADYRPLRDRLRLAISTRVIRTQAAL
jgi:hypothetical protein